MHCNPETGAVIWDVPPQYGGRAWYLIVMRMVNDMDSRHIITDVNAPLDMSPTTQSHVEYLEREREKNSAKTWEAEQKRRRASLEGGRADVGMDEPS